MPAVQTHTRKDKATSKASARGAIPAKSPTTSAPEDRADVGPSISPDEREKLVARAAYFRAEKRGFAPGCELQDWVEAEAEVLRLIGA